MSYDVGLYDADDNEITSRNITSNVAPMWQRAGIDLADIDGQRAGDVHRPLCRAVAAMLADPDTYRAMDPVNGWGSYESCVEFLYRLALDFGAHPNAIVVVSR